MSKPHMTSVSNLPSWLTMVAKLYPPKQVALVGAGNGTGPLVQWLHNWTSDAGQGALGVTLLEPHPPSMAQLAKRLAEIEACADWQLLPDMLAPEHGDHTYHQYTLAAENGLLPLEALHPLWPSLQLQSQQQAATVALTQLLPAGWLLLDCLPAAHLLQVTPLPSSTQVVLVRVVLSNAAPAGCSLTSVQTLLTPSGFKAVATFAERNSALGKVLFVRDPKCLQEKIEQLSQAKEQALAKTKGLEADKAQLIEAKDKALAQAQQLAQEKAQLQKQVEELTKQLALSKESLKDLENRLRNDMNKGLSNAVKQLEAFQRIRDFLGTVDGLGDFHGWPISPDIGLFLLERMRAQHYDLIIEFGSGTSTALFAQAAQVLEQQAKAPTKIVSFEHDTLYHAKTLQLLKTRGLDGRVSLVYAPLVDWREGDETYLYYDCQASLAELAKQYVHRHLRILVLIDGPPGATCPDACYPAVPLVFGALAKHDIDLVLDDASRHEEIQIIELWKKFWKQYSHRRSTTGIKGSEKGIYYSYF